MKINLIKISLALLLTTILTASCSQQKMAFSGKAETLEIVQNAESLTFIQNIKTSEVVQAPAQEITAQSAERIKTIKPADKAKNYVSKLKNTRAGAIMTKTAKVFAEKNISFAQHKTTMGITKDTPAALRSVGLIFIVFGLIALIPPLAFGLGSYMYVIAGMLLAIGVLFLLTGTARGAEK